MTFRMQSRATAQVGSRSNLPPMLRAAALALVVTACTASAKDVQPPNDADCSDTNPDGSTNTDCHRAKFFWPTGLALSPDESTLFVANANSDLLYSTGAIDVVDLGQVEAAVGPWLAAPTAATATSLGCTQDSDFAETMICHETPYLRRDAAVRIGDFATAIGVQDKQTSNHDLRLIVPVRGDPSITWVDWDGAGKTLGCDVAGAGGFPICDDTHRLTHLRGDPNLDSVLDEPFDVFVDSGNQYAVITHLTSGSATLVDTPASGTPIVSDEITGLFTADPNTGLIGASAVAGRVPGAADDVVYVTSTTENRVQQFTVVRPDGGPALLDPGDSFFLSVVGSEAGDSLDSRGLAFGSGGDRMYLIDRNPPLLEIFDTSIGPEGAPQDRPLAGVDICRNASRLTVADSGDGERVYVACFDAGQVYVIDPSAGGNVEAVITVGRGPYDLAASPSKKRLYVTNYLEDTVSVIDLTPGAPTRNRVVMRLGEPKAK